MTKIISRIVRALWRKAWMDAWRNGYRWGRQGVAWEMEHEYGDFKHIPRRVARLVDKDSP